MLLLTIADSGPGVPEELQAAVFERYARGTSPDHPEGTGIGLYVARELTRAMEGSLDLEPSGPGQGAAFTMVLPAEASSAGEP